MIFPIPIIGVFLVVALVYAESASSSSWTLEHLTRYLAATVRRNLPIGSSLSAYAQDLPGWRFGKRKVLVEIADMVDNGLLLADAMERHPACFPRYYRALVRAGEAGGNLGSVLERLSDTVELDAHAARRAAGYAFYPAMLAWLALLAVTVMLIQLGKMREETCAGGGALPPFAFALGARGLASLVFILFGGVALLCIAGPSVWRRAGKGMPGLAAAWAWLVWHLLPFRRYERQRAVAQWTLAAGRLMEAGIPDHQALVLSTGAGGNAHFDGMARAAASGVEEGTRLSEALSAADRRRELPPELLWYVELGETSGRLPEALVRASETAGARSRSILSHLVSLVFPAGIVLVALVVGMMAYAVFGSLVELMESLG